MQGSYLLMLRSYDPMFVYLFGMGKTIPYSYWYRIPLAGLTAWSCFYHRRYAKDKQWQMHHHRYDIKCRNMKFSIVHYHHDLSLNIVFLRVHTSNCHNTIWQLHLVNKFIYFAKVIKIQFDNVGNSRSIQNRVIKKKSNKKSIIWRRDISTICVRKHKL